MKIVEINQEIDVALLSYLRDIVLCFCFVCLRLCCRFLWSVHFCIALSVYNVYLVYHCCSIYALYTFHGYIEFV
jgi:hypothetical protein